MRYLENIDNKGKIVDFAWLKDHAGNRQTEKLLLGIQKQYERAMKGRYGMSRQLFSVRLGDYYIWLRRCSAHASVSTYTDIFKNRRHFLVPGFSGEDAELVIDGGACEGHYTLGIIQNNKKCKVIAVEPNPLAYEALLKNVISNSLTNVILVNKALDVRSGKVSFEMVEQVNSIGGKDMSIIKRPWLKESMIKRVALDSVTLEELCQEYGAARIDILKLDIQGMEADVLKASKRILPDIKKIVVEWHTPEVRKETIEFLEGAGFQLVYEEKRPLGDLYFVKDGYGI